MYIFFKTTHRDEFNGTVTPTITLKKMTVARNPILDPRVPGQVSHKFGPTFCDKSNGIGLVVLSGQ